MPNDATQWARVGILFVIGCAASFHMGKVAVALPALTRELGLTLFGSSSIVSMFSILSGCLGLLIGIAVARSNYRDAAIAGCLAAGVASFVGARADALPLLLVSRVFEGLGWIIVAISLPALLGRISLPSDRSLVLGIWGAFVPAGMTLSLLISPLILADAGWQALWNLAGLISLFCAAVLLFGFQRMSVSVSTRFTIRSVREETVRTGPLMMFGCFLVYSAQFLAVTSFMPTLLLDQFNLAINFAALLVACVIAVNIVGNVGAGLLLRLRVKAHHLLMFAMITMAITGFLIFAELLSLSGRMVAAVCFTAAGGIIPGTLFAQVPEVVRNPLHIGMINGLILQAAGIGQLLGPPLLTWIVDATQSWSYGSLFTTVACVGGLICAFAFGRSIAGQSADRSDSAS